MTAVEQALLEVRAALAVFAPIREGLADYLRLNIESPTRPEVEALLAEYDRRIALLTAAEAALVAVIGDGHPAVPKREVAQRVLLDLQEQRKTIQAALDQFSAITAVLLGLTGGSPENK